MKSYLELIDVSNSEVLCSFTFYFLVLNYLFALSLFYRLFLLYIKF